ncbi:protein suex-1-like [Daphnia carinata]|uniref:protein suex-1-like n=1 Tax=Daphnia carinata TaxID=120202 RepID=UPI00257D3798|nr:protein suex-1-like [Daphnia carinata]
MKIVLLAFCLVHLAMFASVSADEKADQASAEFAAGMEGMNYNGDETKHRPIFILPRPPIYGGYGGYGGFRGGYGGHGGYGNYGGYGGYGFGPYYG